MMNEFERASAIGAFRSVNHNGIVVPTQSLDDISTYQIMTKALIEKGYSKKDINKIPGGNVLRVLKANEVK